MSGGVFWRWLAGLVYTCCLMVINSAVELGEVRQSGASVFGLQEWPTLCMSFSLEVLRYLLWLTGLKVPTN